MDNNFDTEKAIRDYLPNIIHMSLATSQHNKPWVCELHYVYDDDLNIYFFSKPSRRHSREIAVNPQVAGNMVVQHKVGEKPLGVYFEGRAELLNDVDENHVAYKLYCERLGAGPWVLEEMKKEDGHQFYKIIVTDFYVFDARESVPSQKYHLSWAKAE